MPGGRFSATHARPRLLRRLRTLRNLEWFNVPFLILVLSRTWPDRSIDSTWQRLVAYLLVAAFLIVGGWYWHLKVRQIGEGRSIRPEMAWLARFERIALMVLIVATSALVASHAGQLGVASDRGWATGLLALAWAEYVNYFRVQLMHDTRSDLRRLRETKRLRASWMARDLAEHRRR